MSDAITEVVACVSKSIKPGWTLVYEESDTTLMLFDANDIQQLWPHQGEKLAVPYCHYSFEGFCTVVSHEAGLDFEQRWDMDVATPRVTIDHRIRFIIL